MRSARNVSLPFRPSFGRNHEAQSGTILGAVESLLLTFFLSAVFSSAGLTRYVSRPYWAIAALVVANVREQDSAESGRRELRRLEIRCNILVREAADYRGLLVPGVLECVEQVELGLELRSLSLLRDLRARMRLIAAPARGQLDSALTYMLRRSVGNFDSV